MKKMHFHAMIFLSLFFLHTSLSFSQSELKEQDYYNWFDAIVGTESTGLYNGVEYIELYRTSKDNHQFLDTSNFVAGSISYDGQTYYDVLMKYNVFEDQVLVKLQNRVGETIMQTLKNKTHRFSLNGHNFLNITNPEANANDISGYHEVLTEDNNLTLLKKHRMRIVKKLDRSSVYYDFKERNSEYVLLYKDAYYNVSSKNDINKIFPQYKKEVNTVFANNRAVNKSNPDAAMTSIIKRVQTLLLQEK
jgi:hypothetical protein